MLPSQLKRTNVFTAPARASPRPHIDICDVTPINRIRSRAPKLICAAVFRSRRTTGTVHIRPRDGGFSIQSQHHGFGDPARGDVRAETPGHLDAVATHPRLFLLVQQNSEHCAGELLRVPGIGHNTVETLA